MTMEVDCGYHPLIDAVQAFDLVESVHSNNEPMLVLVSPVLRGLVYLLQKEG